MELCRCRWTFWRYLKKKGSIFEGSCYTATGMFCGLMGQGLKLSMPCKLILSIHLLQAKAMTSVKTSSESSKLFRFSECFREFFSSDCNDKMPYITYCIIKHTRSAIFWNTISIYSLQLVKKKLLKLKKLMKFLFKYEKLLCILCLFFILFRIMYNAKTSYTFSTSKFRYTSSFLLYIYINRQYIDTTYAYCIYIL